MGSLITKLAGPLMKVAIPLANNVLVPLGITDATSAIDAGIQKTKHGSGSRSLIISNEEMNDIIKTVQALVDSNILLKGVTKTMKNKTKEQKGGFLSMFLGTSGTRLLGSLLTGKGIARAGSARLLSSVSQNKKRKRIARAGTVKKMGFSMPPHPLTNFEIQKHYKNERRFISVFSRNNLPTKIKAETFVINVDQYADIGTRLIALFCNRNEIVYFDSFGFEHILEEIKEFIRNKNQKANIFRVQANDPVLCGYLCIGFIDFMLAGKKLTDYTNLFSLRDLRKMII